MDECGQYLHHSVLHFCGSLLQWHICGVLQRMTKHKEESEEACQTAFLSITKRESLEYLLNGFFAI